MYLALVKTMLLQQQRMKKIRENEPIGLCKPVVGVLLWFWSLLPAFKPVLLKMLRQMVFVPAEISLTKQRHNTLTKL